MNLDYTIKQFNLVKNELKNTTLVLASKTINADFLIQFIKATGHLQYGENYAKELTKWDFIMQSIPNIDLSFIGKFQNGNIKKIIKYCNTIEGVSSFEDLQKIKFEANRMNKKIKVYAQINIGGEVQKNGFIISKININDLKQFDGLMCIPPQGESNFYFEKMNYLKKTLGFLNLSMGMSGDYKNAILHGSTEIRIGTLIFGERK
jgi:PLP dependent protein